MVFLLVQGAKGRAQLHLPLDIIIFFCCLLNNRKLYFTFVIAIAIAIILGPTTDAGFLYGYVFFRQKQDPSIRRGYFQKSVVVLTQHPFIGLFSKIVSVLGPAYFEIGKPMLETAFHDIARWRAPTTDSMMELPFMGQLLQVQLAKPQQPQLLETSPFEIATYQPDTHILSSVPINGGLYKHFQDLVPDLWLCWELMTLAEPIMLIGTSPEVCSESVASLVDLINPVRHTTLSLSLTLSKEQINKTPIDIISLHQIDSILWRLPAIFHNSGYRLQVILQQTVATEQHYLGCHQSLLCQDTGTLASHHQDWQAYEQETQ